VRANANGKGEIWKVNLATGVEECILSDIERSFSTPSVSPDGEWVLAVGSTPIHAGDMVYWNTDIYVCRMDGTRLSQLTYHAADDLSPEWSRDGKYIYFISQRGSQDASANIWRMSFNVL
jgi:Tol biopolymer transport system component